MVEFEALLAGLDAEIRTRKVAGASLVVAEDFNARYTTWGSETVDVRGAVLERFAAALDLWPENVGSNLTFAVGDRTSVIIDIRSATEGFGHTGMAG